MVIYRPFSKTFHPNKLHLKSICNLILISFTKNQINNFIGGMDNPENAYHTLDVTTMYKYDNHTNIPWAISEYHTPKFEMNIDLELKKRKWESQKKGEKNTKYVTKRGFYMDYQLKVAKTIPSVHAHGAQNQWNFEQLKKISLKNKIDPKLIKNTYLDKIQIDQKNRKVPGICTYSLEKSLKEQDAEREKLKKRKISTGEKVYFYQNTEHLSNVNPGPGNYCPHDVSPKERMNKTDYKFWIKKHKDQETSFLKRDGLKPAPGTHSPMNTTLATFDQLATESKKPTKVNYLGKDAKFEYTRESKRKVVEKRPDPSSYSTIIEWKGKDVSPKKTSWNELVWKGHSQSIYH